ncbi:hypothetical protein BT69DRAFT_1339431 [Atractiella rhizophila]|nr:hypothetical protein BT69DRAFT_1339431 [Atractiella rhizophila]
MQIVLLYAFVEVTTDTYLDADGIAMDDAASQLVFQLRDKIKTTINLTSLTLPSDNDGASRLRLWKVDMNTPLKAVTRQQRRHITAVLQQIKFPWNSRASDVDVDPIRTEDVSLELLAPSNLLSLHWPSQPDESCLHVIAESLPCFDPNPDKGLGD